MLLQSSSLHSPQISLPSSSRYSPNLQFKAPYLALIKAPIFQKLTVSCSISKIHSYGTVDFEKKPFVKWKHIFKKVSLMEKPELGSATVLNELEKGGRKLTKWELCRVVRELRKFNRHRQALEVYDWMNNRGERFMVAPSDAAIQLDLTSKVRGVSGAEDYFLRLPDELKDGRVYTALLNAYVQERMQDKAESLIETMRGKGYVKNPLPFNVMMTLYMKLKDYDKADSIVEEMKQRNVSLDVYSYNIWLSSCGSQGSVEKLEQVFEEMKANPNINQHWSTHSTMASMYAKMGLLEKAEESLKMVESTITGRDRTPYHYIISLYGNIGKKDDIYRTWEAYKSKFPSIPNLGYHAVISSLIRVDDIEGAEKVYEEWMSVKSAYDMRLPNILMGAFVKKGDMGKAEILFDQMVKDGGKPNQTSWEALAEGHIKEKRLSEALSFLKRAFAIKPYWSWKPRPRNITAFFDLCKENDDNDSREVLVQLLRESGFLESKDFASLIGLSNEVVTDDELLNNKERTDDNSISDENESDDSEVLLGYMQGSA